MVEVVTMFFHNVGWILFWMAVWSTACAVFLAVFVAVVGSINYALSVLSDRLEKRATAKYWANKPPHVRPPSKEYAVMAPLTPEKSKEMLDKVKEKLKFTSDPPISRQKGGQMGLKEDVKTGKISLGLAIRRANRRDGRFNESIRGWLARRKKRGGAPGPSGGTK